MYLKIPFDGLMDMPVYVRKFWIDKYIAENSTEVTNPNDKKIDGMNINTYAQIEQDNINNRK